VAEKRDVADGSDEENEEGTNKDEHSEKSGESESSSGDTVGVAIGIPEVLGHIVPSTGVILSHHPNGIKSDTVNGLTGSVGEQQTLPLYTQMRIARRQERKRDHSPLKVKKTKNAKSSISFVESEMCSKKQKWL